MGMSNAERQARMKARMKEEVAWFRSTFGDVWPGRNSVASQIASQASEAAVKPKPQKVGKVYFWGGKFRNTSDGMPAGMADWQWEKILLEG